MSYSIQRRIKYLSDEDIKFFNELYDNLIEAQTYLGEAMTSLDLMQRHLKYINIIVLTKTGEVHDSEKETK
jgi:hypothetical protein